MHFRILKAIATSGFLTALECTKFFSAGEPRRTQLGELTELPRPRSWFKGEPTSKGKGRAAKEKGRKGRREEGMEREWRGRKGRNRPLTQIPGSAPGTCYLRLEYKKVSK